MNNQYSFNSNCECLHSDSAVALEKFSENTSPNLEVNEHSYNQKVSSEKIVKNFFVSNESIHVMKLNTIRKRMLTSLKGIKKFLGNRPLPDGVEDLKRRQQRAIEFSSRFCRNYLYPLQQQMNTIAKMWKNVQLNHSPSAYFTLCQKVIATHQNAQSALQAYLHHMPCSVEKGVPDKLEELLQIVDNLCSLCSTLDISEGDSDYSSKKVKYQCQQLVQQMKIQVSGEEEQDEEQGEEDSDSAMALSQTCIHKEVSNTKSQLKSQRFSMYSRNTISKLNDRVKIAQIPRTSKNKNQTSKRKYSKLNSIKLSVKEISDPEEQNVTKKSVLHKKQEKHFSEDTRIGEVCANDDVKTMMEFLISQEGPANCEDSSKTKHSNSISFMKGPDRSSASPNTSSLKKIEADIKTLQKHTKLLEEMGHPNYFVYIKVLEAMSVKLTEMKAQIPTSSSSSHIHKSQDIVKAKTVMGSLSKNKFPNNVKLVFLSSTAENYISHEKKLKDDNSKIAEIHQPEKLKTSFQEENLIVSSKVFSDFDCAYREKVSTLKHLPESLVTNSEYIPEDNVNLPNLITPGENSLAAVWHYSRPQDVTSVVSLKLNPQETSMVEAYHKFFNEYSRGNSLYQNSIRPWILIERMANNMMDNVLEDIIFNEIGIQKITSGLLHLEFQ